MMRKMVESVLVARTGGRVERCHRHTHTGSYSVAMHSWGVAMLMWQLWPQDFGRLGPVCLAHDLAECLTGDMPFPVGQRFPELREQLDRVETRFWYHYDLPGITGLSPADRRKIRACDSLEFYIWCREELERGNNHMNQALLSVVHFLEQEFVLPQEAETLFSELQKCRSVIKEPQWP